ncbi:histidine phosphatase family protein [Candidatus Viridilinea mediisalina]|uniref:Phosphoglycerate kinase n=1 Tax=Candidatus Viridilinea mediisalina TaxID=2024553 RepID=A0A2A6RJ37_9CHLR|nr:histidine phosphatase family protein [Candidatus Viridilinea mediisalina]PDW02906.1 phosphoglycerate kinase [Candidatus Viridilinea mediisalina]
MTTTVYLIRHGETDWNMIGRWQGHTDVPLNEIGFRQARLVAQRLATEGVQFDAIYSSDLTRAYQTAWEVGAAVKVAVQLLPNLREIDLGTWSGLTYDEIRAAYPTEIALIEQGQDIPRGGAETVSALRKRVVEAVGALAHHHRGATLGLITHGGCIRMLLAHADNYTGNNFKHFPHIGNTSVSVVRIKGAAWQIELVNDMSHLEAVAEPGLASAPPDDAERPAL